MNSYKTYKLTDLECKSCKPKAKLYKLHDGGALSLDVMPLLIVFMVSRKRLLLGAFAKLRNQGGI